MPFRTAAFTLTNGLESEQWTLQIHGAFSLWEIPKLKELLDIYASLGEPPPAAGLAHDKGEPQP